MWFLTSSYPIAIAVVVVVILMVDNNIIIIFYIGLRALAVTSGGFSHHPPPFPALQHWAPSAASQQVLISSILSSPL